MRFKLDPANSSLCVEHYRNRFLKLDTSNGPLTGDLEISKATPVLLLNDARCLKQGTEDRLYSINQVVKTGTTNYAISLNGINQCLSKVANASANAPNDTSPTPSISIWIKPNVNNVQQAIYAICPAGAEYGRGLIIGIDATGKLYFSKGTGSAFDTITGTTTVTTGTWHHVVATFDGVLMRLYLDNVLEASGGTSTAINYTAYHVGLWPSSVMLYVGAYKTSAFSSGAIVPDCLFFNGLIDELVTYRYPLSTSYNATSAPFNRFFIFNEPHISIEDLYNSGLGSYRFLETGMALNCHMDDKTTAWVQTNTYNRWRDVALSADGAFQAACAYDGYIYSSIDSGANWFPQYGGGKRNWVSIAISSDGAVQTALVYFGQIYTSSDSGVTWTARDSDRKWVRVAMSNDGVNQTAVVRDGQIYTSSDSGATWTARDSNRKWNDIAMCNDGSKQTAVDVGGYLYVSTDTGVTWAAKATVQNWQGIAVSGTDGTKQVATIMKGRLYQSSDSGNTWTIGGPTANQSWQGMSISDDGTKRWGVGMGNYIWKSTDSGATWASVRPYTSWTNIACDSDASVILIVNTYYDYGMLARSVNSGVNWNWIGAVGYQRGMACSADGRIITLCKYQDQLRTSYDYGVSWQQKGDTLNWWNVAMSADGVYQTATIYSSGYLWTSSDSGLTWTARDALRNWRGVAMSSDGQRQIACAYGGRIYLSTDYGVNWTPLDAGGAVNRNYAYCASSSDGTVLTANVYSGQIWVSLDSGANWTAYESNRFWNCMAMSGDGRYQTTGIGSGGAGTIYVSSDYGVTWTPKITDVNRHWYGVAMSSDGMYQIAASNTAAYVYSSSDYGVTWNIDTSSGSGTWYGAAMSSDGSKRYVSHYGANIVLMQSEDAPTTTAISASKRQQLTPFNLYGYPTRTTGEKANYLTQNQDVDAILSERNYSNNEGTLTFGNKYANTGVVCNSLQFNSYAGLSDVFPISFRNNTKLLYWDHPYSTSLNIAKGLRIGWTDNLGVYSDWHCYYNYLSTIGHLMYRGFDPKTFFRVNIDSSSALSNVQPWINYLGTSINPCNCYISGGAIDNWRTSYVAWPFQIGTTVDANADPTKYACYVGWPATGGTGCLAGMLSYFANQTTRAKVDYKGWLGRLVTGTYYLSLNLAPVKVANILTNDRTITVDPGDSGRTVKIQSPYGYGVYFGTVANTDYISSTTKLPTVTALMTVSCWVKVLSTISAYVTIWGSQETNKGIRLCRSTSSGSMYYWYFGMGTAYRSSGQFEIPLNQWNHVVCVKDAGMMRAYVNGVEIVAARVATADNISPATATNFTLGRNQSGANYYWTGSVDELKVYDVAWSDADVLADYNAGQGVYGGPTAGLVLGYHFDEGTGTTTADYSGGGFTGTLYGSTKWIDGEKVAFVGTVLDDWFDQSVKTTASPAFAGLAVDTNSLKVDSSVHMTGIVQSSPKAKLHGTGSTIIGCASSAIADGDIGSSQGNIWIEEVGNNLTFKVKYSDGTIKTATVAVA